jgi:hypothetical protein
LSFLSDVIDLPNSSDGGQYREVINTIILQRGATLTRIMIAALTGALPSGRLEEVGCKLLSLFQKKKKKKKKKKNRKSTRQKSNKRRVTLMPLSHSKKQQSKILT